MEGKFVCSVFLSFVLIVFIGCKVFMSRILMNSIEFRKGITDVIDKFRMLYFLNILYTSCGPTDQGKLIGIGVGFIYNFEKYKRLFHGFLHL